MFKSSLKIRELTETLEQRDQEIKELNRKLNRVYDRLDSFVSREDGTPEDCTRGIWCRACEFSTVAFVPARDRYNPPEKVYFCGKGKSCSNFVQKGEKE